VSHKKKLFCKQKPLLKIAYATFLQAKAFTKNRLRNFCKQSWALPTSPSPLQALKGLTLRKERKRKDG
jgi:Ran GTPase-activating protein (RanGAP) involved in mRNA processing and transport